MKEQITRYVSSQKALRIIKFVKAGLLIALTVAAVLFLNFRNTKRYEASDESELYFQFYKQHEFVDTVYAVIRLLPLIVLACLAVYWVITNINTGKENKNSLLLNSYIISSQTLAALAFILCILASLYCVGQIFICIDSLKEMESGTEYYDSEVKQLIHGIIFTVLSALGVVSAALTSIAKTKFYKTISRSLNGEEPDYKSAGFYRIMKIANIPVKALVCAGFMVNAFITEEYTTDSPVSIIFFIVLILTGIIGITDNALEALFAYRFKKVAVASGGGFCPSCGAPQNGEPKFCARCGTQLR